VVSEQSFNLYHRIINQIIRLGKKNNYEI